MVNKYNKKTKKNFKKKHEKGTEIFLKKKKKCEKRLETDTKISLNKKKEEKTSMSLGSK